MPFQARTLSGTATYSNPTILIDALALFGALKEIKSDVVLFGFLRDLHEPHA
jgi:hypothetical protein